MQISDEEIDAIIAPLMEPVPQGAWREAAPIAQHEHRNHEHCTQQISSD